MSIHLRGYVFYKNQLYLSAEDLFLLFEDLISINEVCELATRFNGSYSIIIKNQDNIYLVSDLIRSYQYLYSINDGVIHISDNIISYDNSKIDNVNLINFIETGYSYADATIYENIMSIQSAEIVSIDIDELKIKTKRYFRFAPSREISNSKNISIQDFVIEFERIMVKTIKRMIDSAPNVNNWIVPLSGGHDSRILVNYLYKLGVKNVITFSYGKPGNVQSSIAEEVAKTLNYKYYFIEYTEDKWHQLHKSKEIDKYIDYAF